MHWIILGIVVFLVAALALLTLGLLAEVALLLIQGVLLLLKGVFGLVAFVVGAAFAVVAGLFQLGLVAALAAGLVVLWMVWRTRRAGRDDELKAAHERVRRCMRGMERRMRNLEAILHEKT